MIHVKATTRAQRVALLSLFRRSGFPDWGPCTRVDRFTGQRVKIPTAQWRRFRKGFRWGYGDFIGGEWKGMFVGIERDGYTHT